MKLLTLLFLVFTTFALAQDPKEMPHANAMSVELSRYIAKDIFELNGVPFMKPLVQAINATANSRFFSSAYVPTKVEKAYFRVSLNGMAGLVRDDMKTYSPQLPQEEYQDSNALKFVSLGLVNGTFGVVKLDTANLVHYLFKTLLYDGINGAVDKNGKPTIDIRTLKTPERAATILGSQEAFFPLNGDTLVRIASNRIDILNSKVPGVKVVSQALQDTINNILRKLPSRITLPPGGNFSSLIAGVPQIEIGSYYGTELLIRFIPPVDMGTSIGKFSFYGLGLKHNLSQYFEDPSFNMALQAVYQATSLTNQVGATNSQLQADAKIINLNLHASKKIKDWFDVYCGFSFENVTIESKFTYKLMQETQLLLGMLESNPRWILSKDDPNYIAPPAVIDPSPGYPGDKVVQVSSLTLKDNNYKLVFGLHKEIGNFGISIDANISKFNILTSGIYYRF
ncbi:MAG: hypothetical protein NTW25_13220 [Candidatus Kapabacteria bacterium]|nr:hypothetical protein [Candidatus Kapabacteria bacterium]